MDEQQLRQLRYLFSRYANGLSTRAEYDEFLELLDASENDEELRSLPDQLWEELEEKPETETITQARPYIYRLLPYGIAAAALIGVAVTYFVLQPKATNENTIAEQIAPIQKGVTLKTGNGKLIQ